MSESSLEQTQSITLWHDIFESLMRERAPDGFEIHGEVRLKPHAARVDLLILRRIGTEDTEHAADDPNRMLRKLWSRLPLVTVVEFKSPVRNLRRGELLRLNEYRSRYLSSHWKEIPSPKDLAKVLIVPNESPALTKDLAYMGWNLSPIEPGYAIADGACYTTYVIFTDKVCNAEHDDFLRIVTKAALKTQTARHWLDHWIMTKKEIMPDITQREGYQEIQSKLINSIPIEERLAGITPEQRLAGITPEQRLAGLDPEQVFAQYAPEQRLAGIRIEERLAGIRPEQRMAGLTQEEIVLTLPDNLLRALSDDFVATLSPETQRTVRDRLTRSTTSNE